jgi:hypothetical protein
VKSKAETPPTTPPITVPITFPGPGTIEPNQNPIIDPAAFPKNPAIFYAKIAPVYLLKLLKSISPLQ